MCLVGEGGGRLGKAVLPKPREVLSRQGMVGNSKWIRSHEDLGYLVDLCPASRAGSRRIAVGQGVRGGRGSGAKCTSLSRPWLHTEKGSSRVTSSSSFPKSPFELTAFALSAALLFSPSVTLSKAPPPNCLKSKR